MLLIGAIELIWKQIVLINSDRWKASEMMENARRESRSN